MIDTQPTEAGAQLTPLQIVAGPLGSGKTTLLRRLLAGDLGRVAVLVNEFGDLGIDGEVVAGRAVDRVELTGGCVCCSLAGEFEAAIDEIIDRVAPELILVEATGVAEADALVLDVEDNLPRVRIDAVVVLLDADVCQRFGAFGYAERAQLEAADIVLINKVELVDPARLDELDRRVAQANPDAVAVHTQYAAIDPILLAPDPQRVRRPLPSAGDGQRHTDHALQTITWDCPEPLARDCLEQALSRLPPSVYRAKGWLRLDGETMLVSFVAGRWSLERAASQPARLGLVLIGPGVADEGQAVSLPLERCRGR